MGNTGIQNKFLASQPLQQFKIFSHVEAVLIVIKPLSGYRVATVKSLMVATINCKTTLQRIVAFAEVDLSFNGSLKSCGRRLRFGLLLCSAISAIRIKPLRLSNPDDNSQVSILYQLEMTKTVLR